MIELWKSRFKLEGWEITTLSILPEQVTYPENCPEKDKYFVGIWRDGNRAILIHDRELTEEDVVHELTHLKHPKWSEDKVNSFTEFIIKYYNELRKTN